MATFVPGPLAGVAVYAPEDGAAARARAEVLAERLGLPLVAERAAGGFELLLTVGATGLALEVAARGGPGPVRVDFGLGARRYAQALRGSALARAVGARGSARPGVLDATAGLGRDAWRLVVLGCRVEAWERCPLVFALLEDGLARGRAAGGGSDWAGARLTLRSGDARARLAELERGDAPEVVLIDPMFPPRRKAALPKIELRLLRRVIGDDTDAEELLAAARRAARRVVVKRPAGAPPLGPAPALTFTGQSTRYDVYLADAAR